MRKTIALTAVLTVGLLSGFASADGHDVQVKYYVGGVGDINILCPLLDAGIGPEIGLGGQCFNIPAGAELLNITVMDHLRGAAVGLQLGWYSGTAPALTQIGEFEPACGGGVVPVPLGATHLRVFVDGLLNGPADCGTEAPEGVGLVGSISVAPVQTRG